MISLRIILSALTLCVLVVQVSAYWANSGIFGHQSPRFRSNYYSSNVGSGLSSYSPYRRQTVYRRSFGGGGGYWSSDSDYMDDLYDRSHWGYGRGVSAYSSSDFMDDLYDRNQYGRGWM